jgi:hypothetical protein
VWFIDLHSARSSNGYGINPISYTEIDAYFRLNEVIADKWEVDLIRRFDREVLNIFQKRQAKEAKKK